MDWYKRYMADYASKTAGLNLSERGAYDALLDEYYEHEKPLPSDKRELYRIVRAFERWERVAVDRVLAKFFLLTDAGYTNPRADEELAKYKKAGDVSRANGSRHTSRQGPVSLPDGQQKPDTRNQINTKPKPIAPSAVQKTSFEFDRFWEAYPRHEDKESARKAWDKYHFEGHLGELLAALADWTRSREPQYMPYASRWLSKGHWKDIPVMEGFANVSRRSQDAGKASAQNISRILGRPRVLADGVPADVAAERAADGTGDSGVPGGAGRLLGGADRQRVQGGT